MNIVEMMINYIEKRDIQVFKFSELYSDSRCLMIICIELLSWLKLEYKREMWRMSGRVCKSKPKVIPVNASWFELLNRLVCGEQAFSSAFELCNRELTLNKSLTESQKNTLRAMADALYNPTINE